jgi:hypothetical protein
MRPVVIGNDPLAYLDIGNRLLAAIGQEYQSRARQTLTNAARVAFYAGSLGFIGTQGGNPLPILFLIAGKWPRERVGEIVTQPGFYI